MDNSLVPEQQNVMIEDALHTYPVVPLPHDLTSEVMARIQTVPAPRPFRLNWNDFILAAILSACIGALWFSVEHLPPLLVAQIRKETILLYQHLLVSLRWLIPMLALGLATFFIVLTIPYLRRALLK